MWRRKAKAEVVVVEKKPKSFVLDVTEFRLYGTVNGKEASFTHVIPAVQMEPGDSITWKWTYEGINLHPVKHELGSK